ncbi:MAG TPA: ACP S-malonyltransferase [Pseudonocardiaceae bacterium]|nr:ACP S-malonyltransferase [Pseudonocardiaceae bacterium]
MIALLAPGQGAQSPGMLAPWLALRGAQQRIAAWSDIIGLDLLRLGTTAAAEEIKDTAMTQPLVVALSLLVAEELTRRVELPTDAPIAGHSVGELAATAVAGVLTAEDAVAVAAVRGQEMARACALAPTGMSAVLGGDPDDVMAVLAELGLEAANYNGAGQIVVAGPLDALATLAAHKPARTRVLPLPVAGAFHTRFMAPAEHALTQYATQLTAKNPARPLLSNADGEVVDDGTEMLHRLVTQVTRPVRWDSCMATLGALAVTATVELPPAGTLSGLVKRAMKGTVTLALKTPEDLDRVAGLIRDQLATARVHSGADLSGTLV